MSPKDVASKYQVDKSRTSAPFGLKLPKIELTKMWKQSDKKTVVKDKKNGMMD